MNLTEQVKTKAAELGADMVGIAPVERFSGAPLQMSPQGLLPEARCVVVAGIHHLDAAVELGGQPTPHDTGPYDSQCTAMNPQLDDISFLLGRFLESRGHKALPIAASNIWRYHGYKDLEVDFAPDLAHRYAAVAAGLGQIGWNGLVLTPEFGPRARFVSVVTDADLEATPMYDGEDLCDKCMQCVNHCPTDAFRKEVARINEIEIGGKTFKFPQTNKWRCAWAENFALDLAHDIPEKVDEATILKYLEKYGMRGGEEGCCLQFCMNPQRRYYDESYCRPPRRKKQRLETNPEDLLQTIQKILDAAGVDVVAIGPAKDFDSEQQINPELHLPDAASLICIGIRVRPECDDNAEFLSVVQRKLDYAAFEAAHHLDLSGYSAVSNTHIFDELVAEKLGIYKTDVQYTTVLTSAALPALKRTRPKLERLCKGEQVRNFCREAGADLVGFFTVERFARFRDALETADVSFKQTEVVEDKGLTYGPYVPRIETEDANIKSPFDWMDGAKSVIVMGLHFPDTALDTAKVTPAETVGPFAFVRYEAQRLLGDAAFRVIQRLNDSGYRATLTHDLTGLASKVHSCRGMLPDMRANRFAAVLSGLAFIGVHGCPVTSEFGVRQVFIAIVTDCPLPDDSLYEGRIDCHDCGKPCVAACPTSAISDEQVSLQLEGKTIELGRVDCFACDWAKRYCLAGQVGPKYYGLDVDEPLPQAKTVLAVASTVSKANWGVQKRLLDITEECIRLCPARGRRSRISQC